MKLNEIYVDGFGTWNHLRLGDLSPSLTVFYGPNEAGKTTLMHFLRSVLYGVTPERRERYLPPRHGGEPGGSLGLVTDEAYFTAARYVERGADDRGRVTVTLPNGEEQGDRLLREALESVDEATYCNVFAIGLDEINELGALAGAEAARWIYRLTSGLDRVSLYDVIRGLRDERSALLAPSGERSRLGELISHRDTLQTEIEELAVGERRWSKLAVAIDEVDAQTEQLRTELRETERKARRIEVALGLKPLWLERASAIEQRARYDGLPKLIDRPIETLDDINARAEEAQRGRERVRGQRRELHQEIEELGVNDALVRCGCRLEALEEQQGWLAALERESAELGEDVQRLDARIETEQTRLAKLWRHKPTPEAAPDLDEATLETLQPAREAVGAAEQMVAEAKRELDAQRGNQQHYDSQVENALTSSEKLNLPTDIQEAGELVSMLRSRLKSEHKTEQARRRVDELDRERLSLIEGQVLPIEVFTLLAAAFAAAVVVVCWPLVTGGSTIGWWPLAFLGAVGCVFLRYLLEDNRATQLDTCQEQIAAAKKHVDDALAEQERLDEDLPLREGSVAMRLQHAEQHLEELERMMPIEAERRKASQRTQTAEAMLRSAKEELTAAEKEWRSTLRSVGLPDETTAAEVEKLAAQYRNLNELRERSEAKQEEILRADTEYERVAKRIAAIAEETDLVLEDEEAGTLEQLEHLLSERRLQLGRIEHRKKLRERLKELKEKDHKLATTAERIDAERETLFVSAGVDGEQAFRQVVADTAAAAELDAKLNRLTREITAAIGATGSEDDYAELMSGAGALTLDGAWSQLSTEREELDTQIAELAAKRAVLEKDRQTMVEDTSLADRRVELDLVEAQIAEARERWRELAAVGSMLELIRNDYEEHRQPETLLEASKYLERLTRGRYPRVWTPLAEDVLLVDNADGESLAVENLSRGAREQLFLSVRMALVATFARRGVQLPMILDDVLVNFDDHRARVAASVLRDFAAEGHQCLVFTCHEHVWRMFQELDVDVRRLPVRYEIEEEPEIDEVIEEPVVVEAEVVEPTPELPKPEPPKPKPLYVEAEYGVLDPVTEVERIVEERTTEIVEAIETPATAPATAEVEYAAEPIAYESPTALAYGEERIATEASRYETPPPETGHYEALAYEKGSYEMAPYESLAYGAESSAAAPTTPAPTGYEIDPTASLDTATDSESRANGEWLVEAEAAWAESRG